jgi:membrane protein implicated in regulation of membrane protease activity
MKKIKVPVFLVTALAVIYQLSPFIGFNKQLIFLLFLILPFAMIWMVYRILKDGTPTEKTWEEFFYEDHHYKRIGKEEMVKE